MQAAPCGHRAGISGPFRETLAMGSPYMRQAEGDRRQRATLNVNAKRGSDGFDDRDSAAAPSLAHGFESRPAGIRFASRQFLIFPTGYIITLYILEL
jgi:hypothetical protein